MFKNIPKVVAFSLFFHASSTVFPVELIDIFVKNYPNFTHYRIEKDQVNQADIYAECLGGYIFSYADFLVCSCRHKNGKTKGFCDIQSGDALDGFPRFERSQKDSYMKWAAKISGDTFIGDFHQADEPGLYSMGSDGSLQKLKYKVEDVQYDWSLNIDDSVILGERSALMVSLLNGEAVFKNLDFFEFENAELNAKIDDMFMNYKGVPPLPSSRNQELNLVYADNLGGRYRKFLNSKGFLKIIGEKLGMSDYGFVLEWGEEKETRIPFNREYLGHHGQICAIRVEGWGDVKAVLIISSYSKRVFFTSVLGFSSKGQIVKEYFSDLGRPMNIRITGFSGTFTGGQDYKKPEGIDILQF